MFGWILIVYFGNNFMGRNILTNAFLGIAIYFTVIKHIKKEQFEIIFKTVWYIALFAIIYYLLQVLGYDMRSQGVRNVENAVPLCSVFGIENAYGQYLSMAIPLILAVSGWLGSLLMIPIIVAKSTSVMVGAGISILFYYWFRLRQAFWVYLVLLGIGVTAFIVYYDMPMGMMKTRISVWAKSIQDSNNRPLGHGLDSFRGDERDGAIRYFKY
ncbi:unnamed protein product, partial [marine sediment metagenome]